MDSALTILTFVAPLVLIVPGLSFIELAKVRMNSIFERIFVAYISSLVFVFVTLYVGSIINQFYIASLIVVALLVSSSVYLLFGLVKKISHSTMQSFVKLSHRFSGDDVFILILVIGLISVYVIFLYYKGILDSDVVQDYLPIARQIVVKNGFGYGNGYDMNILLKPIGVSVLYGWNYVTSSSIFSETFRLIPLVPIVITIASTYAIAFSVTKSKRIGLLSTAVLLVLPFNDRFLLYTSSYPDIFYYPLIFIAIYFLIDYFETKRTSLLLWMGTGLGIAGLLKAQTLYVLIAFILILVFLELRNSKKILAILSFLTPFYIIVPSMLASSIQKEGFRLTYPSFNSTQIALSLILSFVSIACLYLAFKGRFRKIENSSLSTTRSLVKKLVLLLMPFVSLSSLWYITNVFRFGTLISTSSINLPNYSWALNIIQSVASQQRVADLWHLLAYFGFMVIDPAVMGFILLIPFIIGLFLIFRRNLANLKLLFLIETVIAVVILSTVVISLPNQPGYNPRDIFVLAPFLAISCALGIWHVTPSFSSKNNDGKFYGSVILISFFGLMSYVQSVYYWFINEHHSTVLGHFLSLFSSISGLSLTQTSLQLDYSDRAFFVGDNLIRILILSLVAGIPILVLLIFRNQKASNTKINLHVFSQKRERLIVAAFCVFIMLSVIIIPRIEFLQAQGGVSGLSESELKASYGPLYGLIANAGQDLNGSIVGFNLPSGLAYYLHGIKVFDLTYPANLAFMKDDFSSNSTFGAVLSLRHQGIRYLLLDPSSMQELDASLNFTLSEIVQDPSLANLTETFGNWHLYTLGPYMTKEVSLPLTGWTIYTLGTNGTSYSLSYEGQSLSLTLNPIDLTSRVMIVNDNLPKLNLTDYDYITVRVEGGTNSRVLLRLWMNDDTGFDVSYWKDPYSVSSGVFTLSSFAEKTFRGEAYIGLESSDGQPCSLKVQEISFVKVEQESLIP